MISHCRSFVLAIAAVVFGASLSPLEMKGQEAKIYPIVFDHPDYDRSYVFDVSDTGVAVGSFTFKWDKWRAFRWTEAGAATLLPDTEEREYPYQEALAISADGNVIVGRAGILQAAEWRNETLRILGDPEPPLSSAVGVSNDGSAIAGNGWYGASRAFRLTNESLQWVESTPELPEGNIAYGMSGNGEYIVGRAAGTDGYRHPFRWSASEGMRDLGIIAEGDFEARGVTDDGSKVVGFGLWVDPVVGLNLGGFEWDELEGIRTLPDGLNAPATCISGDGNIVAGYRDIWTDGERRNYAYALVDVYGVDLTGWDGLTQIWGVGGDGTHFAGMGLIGGIERGFVVKYPAPPRIQGVEGPLPSSQRASQGAVQASAVTEPVRDGSVVRAKINRPIEIAFRGVDPGGEELTFFADGLPPGASVVPTPGPVATAAFDGKLTWTPTSADLGKVRNVHLYVRDIEGRRGSLRFRALAVPAIAPTIAAIKPVKAELSAKGNRVRLETVVTDQENDPLTVTWFVKRTQRRTESVASGSTVSFEFDYPAGVTDVEVRVSDSFNVATASTTVTVQDSTAPIVIVAAQAKLPVEKGEIFAAKKSIPRPTARDASGSPVQLSNDAPARLPIGKRAVTWTARDAAGNVAKAKQTVEVVNQRPVANAGSDRTRSTRSDGAVVRLSGAKSSDPDAHDLTYSWRAPGVKLDDSKAIRPRGKFPRGTTIVKLTVTDEAGARSTDEVRVVVKRAPVARSHSVALRVSARDAFEAAGQAVSRNPADPSARLARANAASAYVLGIYADHELSVAQDSGDLAFYATVRARQASFAKDAFSSAYQAYRSTGEAELLLSSAASAQVAEAGMRDLADQ